MRRAAFICLFAGAVLLAPRVAAALSLRDVIELSRAGLSDEVLLALIEVDRPVFSTDANTLKMLKAAGVSERVIIAMVRSGRTPVATAAEPVAPEPVQPTAHEPQIIVIDHHDDEPERVRQVPVAVPVYVPVATLVPHSRDRGRRHDAGADDRPRPDEPVFPVYWGSGGNRRPDAWKEDPRTIRLREELQKDRKKDERR